MTLASPCSPDTSTSHAPPGVTSPTLSRPRVCFIGWADHVHLERWAGHFAHGDCDVSVISVSGLGRYPDGVRQFRIGLRGRGPRWIKLRLRHLLWRIRPDVVHVHWAHFAVAVRSVWRGPLVVTAWGSDVYRSETFSAEEWRALGETLRAAELVTCDSADLAQTIHTSLGVQAERVAVVQWGVDTDLFHPEGPDRRTGLGLVGREVIFSARSFAPVYNQETVIAAFAQVRRRHPRSFLLMKRYGGDPAYLERIRTDIAARGLNDDVRILEAVAYEDMPALYRTADVMVSIPLSDAAPMSLFESMAAGVPSVVCDLPSLREWVRDGETGYLVEAQDASAVAARVCAVLENPERRRQVVQQARALVVDKASQAAHMSVMAGHYRRLAAER
jgi:glycosyltransferase involved in cell wall biosynthesis